jgi:hypothetical protein
MPKISQVRSALALAPEADDAISISAPPDRDLRRLSGQLHIAPGQPLVDRPGNRHDPRVARQ